MVMSLLSMSVVWSKGSVYLENAGERTGNAQCGQMLCAADGKVGKPGGAGQEVVRVQCSKAVWRVVTHSIFYNLLLFYISFCISW